MSKPYPILSFNSNSPEVPRISVICLPKGKGTIGPHAHDFFELVYIEEGEGLHWIGHQKFSTCAGDLCLIAPNEVHDLDGCKDCKVWIVAFEPDALTAERIAVNTLLTTSDSMLISSFLVPKGASFVRHRLSSIENQRWKERLQQMAEELSVRKTGFAETLRAMLMLLLIEIARLNPPGGGECLLYIQPLLTTVLQYIAKNYKQQISLSDVAQVVERSTAYLTDFVRRETGRTVLSWIVEYRMNEARRLLLTTDDSVQQIAAAIGYRDTGNFNRQFRKVHNVPAQIWRQKYWSANSNKH
jgi:AraC-like DNA-binding protein/quercetin dioxygenase-like cupin family protein